MAEYPKINDSELILLRKILANTADIAAGSGGGSVALFTATTDGTVKAPGASTGKFLRDDNTFVAIPGGGDALTANPLSQFASTTSAQLKGVISDETGSDKLVFSDSPALSGTPTAPTAAGGTNTTQIATTAFVTAAVAASSYIDGEVDTYANLPITIGTPALDSAYLVRDSSGVWLLNRKPGGIYIRTANTGALTDWTYAGEFSDIFNDLNFAIYDNGDTSKQVQFQVSSLTTGTTRVFTFQDQDGTLALTSDPRFTDARTPTAHATSHKTGGSDAIKLDELATPNDNTTLDASAALHGLMSKTDKSKLDGIAAGAEVNVNADWNAVGGDAQILNKPTSMTPTAHAASHQNGGSDEIATATPAANAIPKASASGKLDSWISDASTSAKGLVPQATAPAAGVRNVVCIDNAETSYKNAALLDSTNPAALGVAAPGTSLVAARRDHVHALPTLGDLGALFSARSAKTGDYTILAADKGKLFDYTSTSADGTFSLTAAATVGDGFFCAVLNSGTKKLTLDGNSTEEIEDADSSETTKVLRKGESAILFCNGSKWFLFAVTKTTIEEVELTDSADLTLAHIGKRLALNKGTAATLTIRKNSVTAYPVGKPVLWVQTGAGQWTFTASAGDGTIVLNSRGSATKAAGQWAMGTLIQTATDVWVNSGDITT